MVVNLLSRQDDARDAQQAATEHARATLLDARDALVRAAYAQRHLDARDTLDGGIVALDALVSDHVDVALRLLDGHRNFLAAAE